jgi:hypothetical protein
VDKVTGEVIATWRRILQPAAGAAPAWGTDHEHDERDEDDEEVV